MFPTQSQIPYRKLMLPRWAKLHFEIIPTLGTFEIQY